MPFMRAYSLICKFWSSLLVKMNSISLMPAAVNE